jgi:DNA-binding MarR family transcriptional regulator
MADVSRDFTDHLLERWAAILPDMRATELQVTTRLARLGQHLARREEEVFERFGLNRGDVGVLSALRIAGPPHRLSPTRLGRGLMLSSAGVTSRLDRLERRGLITREADRDDRRGVIVELTPRGLELVDSAVVANIGNERQVLGRLDAKEVEALEALLRKLLAGMELPEIE